MAKQLKREELTKEMVKKALRCKDADELLALAKSELYDMTLKFVIDGTVSDDEQLTFGIRDIKDYYTSEGFRAFMLNGKPVLIRGAGWTDDIFLRDTPETNELQVRYVRDMNLNCIRFENIWGTSQNIYDLCDRYGLLVLTGWSCQWEWAEYLGKPIDKKYGGIVSPEDIALISRSFGDQVRWLRRHPSIIAWFVGSDLLPHPDLERKYIDILKKSGEKFEYPVAWGEDLQTEHERYLTEKHFGKPVFVTDWPKEIKAFYMRMNDDGKTVAAADLLVPAVGELCGGSQREERYDVLKARIEELGMNPEDYWWYLELRKYGTAKHAGFGMGFERMIMYLTGIANIRDVLPFPRTTGNADF